MSTFRQLMVVCPLLLASGGCEERQDLREDEALKTVVAQDRKIAKREEQLLSKRGALQRERVKIRDQRANLVSKKLAAAADPTAKAQIEAEESKLVRLEQRLVKQELQLNKRLEGLLQKKSGLVAGKDRKHVQALLLSRREHSVAMREKDLGRREGDLARRERLLADRERGFASRQAKLCPGRGATYVQTVVAPPPRSAASGRYARKDVEPIYKAGLSTMRRKGILVADLPPGIDRLVTEVRHSVSRGDYTKAKFAADQLLAAAKRIRIDRAFIGTKISRLSSAVRRNPVRGAKKTKVQQLFQQATAAYGDGSFRAANKKLNRIYALIR